MSFVVIISSARRSYCDRLGNYASYDSSWLAVTVEIHFLKKKKNSVWLFKRSPADSTVSDTQPPHNTFWGVCRFQSVVVKCQ